MLSQYSTSTSKIKPSTIPPILCWGISLFPLFRKISLQNRLRNSRETRRQTIFQIPPTSWKELWRIRKQSSWLNNNNWSINTCTWIFSCSQRRFKASKTIQKRKRTVSRLRLSQTRKRCTYLNKKVKSRMWTAVTMTSSITQRECATIVTTRMEGQKSHGNAHTISCTQMECARTVTSTSTIKWNARNPQTRTHWTCKKANSSTQSQSSKTSSEKPFN